MAIDWLRDSCTYRAIYREGFFQGFAEGLARRFPEAPAKVRLECLRGWLSFLGEEWLGPPSAEVRAKLRAIDEQSKLEILVDNLTNERLKIGTWDELLTLFEFRSTGRASLR